MRTSDAALKLDFTEPSVTAAKAVAETIAKNGSLQRDMLCGSWSKPMALRLQMVAGRWSLRDMLELVEVMYFAKAGLPADPGACVAALTELVANLPTHTVRSEEQIELQQFSTPAPIGYLAALAARIAPTDLVLEPSAGTGLLAEFASRANARLVLNEIDPARAEMLAADSPGAAVTRHDAELIHDLLAPSIRPYGRSYQSAFIAQHRSSRRPPNSVPASSHRFDASGHGRPLRRHLARPRRDVESRVSEGDRGLYADVAP
ncbi:hypothetical protein [Sphingomonas sp. CFBP 13733]|uniref:hypothetical protein n=1 Tax=Sphingomonas sp. CFBP 13733 TaxID=2775291 RepID=UPI001FD088E4|nr:hypothetical protein [Sphingomonas sp. CFBP 13733]